MSEFAPEGHRPMRWDRERIDDLLDELSKLYRALRQLWLESGSELDFEGWIQIVLVRREDDGWKQAGPCQGTRGPSSYEVAKGAGRRVQESYRWPKGEGEAGL